jgi:hypothetical protein
MPQPKESKLELVPWPKDDEIRWVQWRIGEREAIDAGKTADWNKEGSCSLTDYRVWLLHEQDGLSFQEIGNRLFSQCAGPDNRKMRAYRAHDRVEAEFHRGNRKRATKPPKLQVHAFGVWATDLAAFTALLLANI